ncbi:MAG: 50S ribosomal protein L24 [Candidatus Omnitrophota bacterium]|nr:50S ribosomal protein L24 [Candidatus Omnitrophota bacterium]
MLRIKKNDIVQVIKGKDKGKKGKVLAVLAIDKKAIVEGINMVKKAMRKTRDNQQGGIVSLERPLQIANLMFFCKNCDKPVRIGFKLIGNENKVRICRACKATL